LGGVGVGGWACVFRASPSRVFLHRCCSTGSPTPARAPPRPHRPSLPPCRQQGGGPRPYVDVLGTLYGLTESEREHLLYGVRGNALLVRQGDPRPRKIRIKPHPQTL